MRQYHRLMRRHDDTVQAAAEQEALLRILVSAPGVSGVDAIEVHRKGGYRVELDLAADQADAFLSHLDESGWMSML